MNIGGDIVDSTDITRKNRRRNSRAHQREERLRPTVIHRDNGGRHYDRGGRHNRNNGHGNRYQHVYWDNRHRLRHRIVYPGYNFVVGYNWGPYFSFRYVWPYYHRKHVFVSLGGYWPYDYRYVRYYRYGCHPYRWYGYHPIAQEIAGSTSSYYTYNYYYNGSTLASADVPAATDFGNSIVQSRQPDEPLPESLADKYFDEGVSAFEDGSFFAAAESFAEAARLAPNDMILPFAHSQALMASEQYARAAEVLRIALLKTKPDNRGVFYPRGLYADDETVLKQVETLAEETQKQFNNADLQLLLGYQLLGLGKIDEAAGPLERARTEPVNAIPADILLDLLNKMKYEKPAEKIDTGKTDTLGKV